MAFLTGLAGKVGPYVLCAVLAFAGGVYVGYRWELPAVQAAKLALSAQLAADAKAVAAANAQAAEEIAAAKAQAEAALAARAADAAALQSRTADQRAAIAAQAAKPGQDGPVAPVLEAVHDMLAKEQGQ